jgi:predicted ATPase
VLIGANASGKSNLLSLFRLLQVVLADLERHVERAGGTDSLLHYGPKTTQRIDVAWEYVAEDGRLRWKAGLVLGYARGALILEQGPEETLVLEGAAGTYASAGPDVERRGRAAVSDFESAKAGWHLYHLNDTSETAAIRQPQNVDDNRHLQSDAANLAAYLHLLRETARPYYDRLVRTVQLIFPEFEDFDVAPLELNPRNVMLNWRELGRDKLFGPHDLSDGTLRFMALATLLLQPPDRLPTLLIIDEPELGLHPSAITLLGGLLQSAAVFTQVIVATQSVSLVDQFEPEEIIVTERRNGATEFARLDPNSLQAWLEEYSVGELWEKNVIGGRP